MPDQVCPACGCVIAPEDKGAYVKEGVMYCCKPCATEGQCECGCCAMEEHEES